MNTQQAIAHLKNIGWFVVKEGDKYRAQRIGRKKYCDSPKWAHIKMEDRHLYSPRELIKLAGIFSHEYSEPAKKIVKKLSDGRARTNQRNTITSKNIEKIDEMPSKRVTKEEDIWSWD